MKVISEIRSKINSYKERKDVKGLFSNFLSLVAIQGTNFILPLLVLPYLIKVIGVEKFGLVSFAQVFIGYLIILTDYGFNLTSTRQIAIYRQDKEKLSEIVSTTLVTKLALCVLAFCILLFFIIIVPPFSAEKLLYILGFIMVLGQAIIPTWFFQGIEQMKYLTYINIAGKIFFTILIFILIKKPADYIYVILFYSMGNLVSGLIGLIIIFRVFGIGFKWPSLMQVKDAMKSGWFVFISNFSINAYVNSNLFILGLFTNNTITGYYSIADKIIYAFRQLLNVFFQATYPRVCSIVTQGKEALSSFFNAYAKPFVLIIGVACSLLFLFSGYIISILIKPASSDDIVVVIKILAFVPFIVAANIPAFQTLLAYNYQKSYMLILISGAALNIITNTILVQLYSMKGTAIAVLISEVFITLGLYLILHIRQRSRTVFN